MAKLSTDLSVGVLHPRENLFTNGVLAAVSAEIIVSTAGASTVSLDIRGTYVGNIEVAGTVDGTNWVLIPIRPQTGGVYVLQAASAQGVFVASCAGYQQVRARMTAYTSGSATCRILATTAWLDDSKMGAVTPLIGTTIGASGAATTLTLTAPGAGLRHYLTYLSINRFAAAALTAAATPVAVTTTNLPGSLAFTFPADALTLGQMDRWREDFAYAIVSSAQNTATTIVCPATTGVIWRVTAGYYVAP